MKKTLLTIGTLLASMMLCVQTTWGQGIGGLISGINLEDPTTWFYVNLTAGVSNPGCGTTTPGKVYLIYTASDEARTPQNPWILGPQPADPWNGERNWKDGFDSGKSDAENGNEEVPPCYMYPSTDEECPCYAENPGWCSAGERQVERIDGYHTGYTWYKSGHYLNNAGDRVTSTNPTGTPDNSSAWGSSASLKGFSYLYAPGFDDLMGYSAYAYFFGKAAENNGWYFTGWSFTEGESDLGGVVGTADSLQFRVLPSSTTGEKNLRNEYVYATFQPVRVSDYKVNGLINVANTANASNSTTVVFDAVGERVDTEDFMVSTSVAEGSNRFLATITSCANNKVTVTVTYTNPAENVPTGEFRGNVTLASKSGCSQLTAPVYARVGADASTDATLYEGKTPTATSGTLTAMITAANNTDKIVVLNRNYGQNLTINAKVTIDLNGYTIKNLTVTGGEVSIAYSKYGSNGTAVAVTGGKLILNGGEFTSLTVETKGAVEQNGATFTEASENAGTLTTTEGRFKAGLTSTGTLTINGGLFEGATAITVSGGTTTINKATIDATTYGIQANGGTTNITSKLVSVNGGTKAVNQTSGTVNLNNGKYDGATAPLAGTINLQAGYFKVDGEHIGISVPAGKKVLNVLAGTEFAEGYRYFVGDDASSVGVCRIGTTSYATLEEALAYANNTGETVTIIMTNDYTLPAGYYTLPATATLIVPMSNEQEVTYPIVNRVSNNSAAPTEYVQPTEFRRLTFAKGVNMDVHGTIELTCTQRASDDAYATLPHGPYGHLVMEEGSHMTLQNGSTLRAWGYMTGKGETDARRGSTVREQFQMGDWKGGSVAFSMLAAENTRVFPITQYYIQNVESPVKYHPGSVLSTTTSVSANYGSISMTAMANDIAVVGVSGQHTAMFLMDQEADAENTWVRKWYDAENDIQTYEVNSGAHLGSMVLDLGKLGTQPLVMNSGYFVLPLTNNMKIHLLSGLMDFTQTTSLLPGAEVEVDKESVIKIVENSDPNVFSGSLYIYDADDWGKANGKGDEGTLYTKVVPYSPSFGGKPNIRTETAKPADAKINVHGSFDTGEGAVYTTPGGANIFSTNEDAGTFIFSNQAPTETSDVYQYINSSGYTSVAAESAKLKNGAGAAEPYMETAGTPASLAFMYMNGAWKNPNEETVKTFFFDCYTADVDTSIYQKEIQKMMIVSAPNIGKYLSVCAQMGEKTIEQYQDMYQGGFKTNVDNAYEQVVSAGYNLGSSVTHVYVKPQEWVEVSGTVAIELPDWDQDYVNELDQHWTDQATDDGGNPLVDGENNPIYNYQVYLQYVTEQANNPSLVSVTGNADHTFSDAAGAGRLFILMINGCQWWEVEKKDNLYHCIHPNNDTYYYWDEEDEEWKEKKFTITWKNWDGTIIQTADEFGTLQDTYSVTYGTMAEFLGTNPTREKTIDYTYDFAGWSPALGPVTGDITYTATYTQKDRMYTVIFQNEGGVEIERQFLKHNEVPVCENTPTKIGHTLEWTPAIAAVTGDATYTATWLENPPTEYEVTFFDYNGTTELQKGNVAVGAMPEYTNTTPNGKPATSEFTYVFDHWSPALEAVSATSIKSYTAVYREVDQTYTVRFFQENGITPIGKEQSLAYGAMPVAPTEGVVKQDPQTGYTYTYVWQNKADASKTIETVKADADYKPVFTGTKNRYTVTLKSNPSEACTFTGAGIYEHDDEITISQSAKPNYTFQNWTNANGQVVNDLPTTVTADIDLTANFEFEGTGYTITWKNGEETLATVNQKENTATTYTGATPTKAADAEHTYTFYGWTAASNSQTYKNGLTPKATADETYTAYFNETATTYTITWANEAGTANIEVDYNQPHGEATAFNSATPTKVDEAYSTYTFDGWATTANGVKVYDNGATPAVSANATYYAHFKKSARPLEIGINGKEEFSEETALSNLIIHSDGTKSGQLIGADYLTITGNAYFDLTLDAAANTWYAVAVPWQVSVANGIYVDGAKKTLNKDYYFVRYNGAIRAEQGKVDNCWQFVNSGNLQPGTFYMIYLRSKATTIRFAKAAGTQLLNTEIRLYMYSPQSPGNDADANWNGIANPAVFHAKMEGLGITSTDENKKAQVFNKNTGSLDVVTLSTHTFQVGEPVFIQAESQKTVTLSAPSNTPAPARRLAPAAEESKEYDIRIAQEDKPYTDRLFISTAEEKADKYVIGQDLAKMGTSAIAAQMWVNRYNAKLCVNRTEMQDNQAVFPLCIFAPKAGEYQISSATPAAEGEELYVTINGNPVWNLAAGAYTAILPAGNSTQYGLLVTRQNAPAMPTDVEETATENDTVRKVLLNNQVYILRNGAIYTITGQKLQ